MKMFSLPIRRFFLSIFSVIVLFQFYGCNTSNNKKKYIIGFSQSGEEDAWRKSMKEEMERELFFHPEVSFIYKETRDNVKQQVQQVEELINEKIDVLIISATDAKGLEPIVSKVYKQGIPVIVIDRNIASQHFTNHISADNKEIGVIAGKYFKSQIKDQSIILEVTGNPYSSPAIERAASFDSIIMGIPSVKLIKIQSDWTGEDALIKVTQQLNDLPKIDGVFAHNDVMAYASARILKKKFNNNFPILGVDALPGKDLGLDLIQKGIITGSIVYPTGGKEAIRNAELLAKHKYVARQTKLKTALIDSNNVETMELQLEKINSQQKDIESQQAMLQTQLKLYQTQKKNITILSIFLFFIIVTTLLLWYSRNLNKKINKDLNEKNKDINEKNKQIYQMSLEAHETHESKINFFTKISHEFRTPLSLIIAPLDELINQPKIGIEIKQSLSLMRKNAFRLLQLVNQLMDMRKIEFGKFQLQVNKDNIISHTQDIVKSFETLAKKRWITLRFISNNKSSFCFFDAYIIEKILMNLLSNAFKYTKDGGYINISIKENIKDNKLIFSVEDNGEGMSDNIKAELFAFFQNTENRSYQSYGIGLALVKELILLHHGNILIESSKNQGTTVQFWIPLNYNYTSNEFDNLNVNLNKADINSEIFIKPLETISLQSMVTNYQNRRENEDRPTILIVEDNDDLSKLLFQKLTENYDVIVFSKGFSAMESILEILPDIVICDIMLPDINGIEITKRCKADIKISNIPIILLTSKNTESQINEGLRTLANAYITKPFRFEHLIETIENLLHNSKLVKEHYMSLSNAHLDCENIPEIINKNSLKSNRKFRADFIRVIEQNIPNEKLDVQMICEEMHISKVQLYRKVKLCLDTNVNEYILSARIQKAKYYLMEGGLTISEIATKTGFSSSSYFSTAFKKYTGYAPSTINSRKN